VRTLDPARTPEAIELLTVAFDADPMFRFLLPEAEHRRGWLRAVMGSYLALTGPDGWVTTVESAGEDVPGVLAYVPPGRYPPPYSRLAAHLLRSPPPWPSMHLARAGLRVLAAIERMHPKTPHYYVQVLGVHPREQGKGLARKLVSAVTSRADGEGVPTYLETTNPVNLRIYGKLGFEVVTEHVVDRGYPSVWTMERAVGGG
jgi:GNAT superfamily N-acetyltransferase